MDPLTSQSLGPFQSETCQFKRGGSYLMNTLLNCNFLPSDQKHTLLAQRNESGQLWLLLCWQQFSVAICAGGEKFMKMQNVKRMVHLWVELTVTFTWQMNNSQQPAGVVLSWIKCRNPS